ncbi:U3 small nucleolar RNA-associated protein 6 homolog [Lytechinus variegatus]|uniref:U3 small nucleolar RNA-associated protein 6 homolog n=1 Tax=Lytechinus variegatus TaxID=7654 RepID=UPI001BB0E5F0|nr:U3 small nucleolar RNA-associated protein 6 homolog [Lytechinus variegatus]
MAEFVHQNIEETLAELEQLERVGLFTKAEIKAIVKKRTAHEYRLGRLKKRKEDFLRYIQYEINILALIKKRRERNNYFHKREEIENAIITRIHRFFRRACTKFPEDLKVWMSHLQFCKKWGRYLEMNRLYTRMLKIHSNNPGLWIMAAKFQLEENNSGENARALFLRSLRHHPKVQKLWTEYFRMELLHADKLRKRMSLLKQTMIEPEESELEDALMRGELARRVYSTAIKEIPDDIGFRLSFIPVVRCFDFTSELEDAVYEDLQQDHPDNDLTWKALAKRHLIDSGTEDDIWLSEIHCHSIFDQGVEKVSGIEIWSHYADTCLERLDLDGSDELHNKRAEKSLAVFESAEKTSSPTEDMYMKWVETLKVLGLLERALEVSVRSTEVHSRSLDLWIKRLILVIETRVEGGDESHRTKVRETFDLAISHVKSKNSLDIWNIGLEWCLTNDTEMIQNLFESGLKEHRAIALPLKIRYLEWTALVKGVGKARKLYKRMATEKPLSEEFFNKYIALEEAQPTPKAKRISEAYDDALKEFGESSPGLWLAYIRHEITHPEGSQGKAMQLHWKAMKTLDGELVEQFVNGYTLMQTKDSGE